MVMRHATVTEYNPWREKRLTPIVVQRDRASRYPWWVASWCGSIATAATPEFAVDKLRARMGPNASKTPVLYYTRAP